MILDATAANRRMWTERDVDGIIYIDQQTALEIPPTLFCDNTKTPFRDGIFDTIFYDPPHDSGLPSLFWGFPNEKAKQAHFKDFKGVPTYYGTEVYDTMFDLIKHIAKAQREFLRILTDDGLVWLKWNETKKTIGAIKTLFAYFDDILTIPVDRKGKGLSTADTYWVCFAKKKIGKSQRSIHEFSGDDNLTETVLKVTERGQSQSKFHIRRRATL